MTGAILTVLLFGVLAGLDNLQVCSSIGLLPMAPGRRHRLAMAFSACEMAAPIAGLAAGHAVLAVIGPYARIAAPMAMILCGIAVFIAAMREKPVSDSPLLSGLPVSLSLDNLVAGFGIGALACPVWIAALLIGTVSAAMSCAGLYGAAAIRLRLRVPVELAVGPWMCIIAIRMLVGRF